MSGLNKNSLFFIFHKCYNEKKWEAFMEEEKKKSKKGLIILLCSLLGIVLIAAIVFMILFFTKPKYEIKINTDGRKITKDIVIKDNVIKELPEVELKEGEVFSAWVNKDGEAMRPNLKLDRNDEITPIVISPPKQPSPTEPAPTPIEIVTVHFETGTSEKIPDIKLQKGSNMIFPVKPTHKEWKFLYWVDKNGYIVFKETIVNEDMTLVAYWWKPKKAEVTISFDTETDEKIDDITITQGSTIPFPTPKKNKENSIFKGWLNEEGKLLDNTYKAETDMKLKANWISAYTCPEGCTPIGDGHECTRDVYSEVYEHRQCPGNYIEIDGKCFDTHRKYYSEHIDHDPWWTCSNPSDEQYDEVELGGAIRWCAPTTDFEVKKVCPQDLMLDGDRCKKTETVQCTKN